MGPIRVVHFHRRPRAVGNQSIETYYRLIRENTGPEFRVTPFVSRFESKGMLKRLYNVVEACFHQGDVNHITGDVHFLSLLMRKRKTILTVLDCGILKDTTGWKRKLVKLLWFNWPLRRVSYITAISEATKRDLLGIVKFPAERIKVIHVCVSPIFKPSPKEFNTTCPRILHIGTAPNKNLKGTIAALRGIPCTLVVIGKESPEEEQFMKDSGLGYEWYKHSLTEEEVYNEYLKCDILSFVSHLEGFGMPIIEANASGRVVITGNLSSMPEVAGGAALLVDPFDSKSIRDGFLKLIGDPDLRHDLVIKGFQNVKRFSIENLARQHETLYSEVYATR